MKSIIVSIIFTFCLLQLDAQFVYSPDRLILGVDSIDDSTISTFFYVDKFKKAIRLGEFAGGQHPNSSQVGSYSSIRGQLSTAKGAFSTSYGVSNTVFGNYGFANGSFNSANGIASMSVGKDNQSLGDYSLTFGEGNIASGKNSIAFGLNNLTSQPNSIAWGQNNDATESLSTAWGSQNNAAGSVSTTWGFGNNAYGEISTIWGAGNVSDSVGSTAWGTGNKSLERYTTTWGNSNEALGRYSTAFGDDNVVTGENATVTGEGNGAYFNHQLVIGKYNQPALPDIGDFSDPNNHQLFVVGNGKNDLSRSNALVVNRRGHIGIGVNVPKSNLHLKNFSEIQIGDEAKLSNNSDGHFIVTGSLLPMSSNYALGNSVLKWNAVYAVSGFIQTSDIRLKENIVPMKDALNKIKKLQPISYNLITHPFEREIGFSAQALEGVIPEAVKKESFINKEGEKDYHYGVNYSELIPVLTKAIQEQQEIIEQLQREVEVLKQKG